MFVFLKALCARFFTSAAQIVERAQTVFRHLNYAMSRCADRKQEQQPHSASLKTTKTNDLTLFLLTSAVAIHPALTPNCNVRCVGRRPQQIQLLNNSLLLHSAAPLQCKISALKTITTCKSLLYLELRVYYVGYSRYNRPT